MSDERRYFQRVPFDQDVLIKMEGVVTHCHLLDISLKGALVSGEFTADSMDIGASCDLHMDLSAAGYTIDATTVVRFMKEDQIGLQFTELSLDSLTHLRRLVELNLGDTEVVRQELFFIVDQKAIKD